MKLTKYSNPAYRPTTFSELFDSFFNDLGTVERASGFRPGADVVETDESYEVHVAVPGMEKKDLTVDIDNGILTISGERKFENEENGKNYRSIETRYGSFNRSFNVPDTVNAEKIKADYKDGILKVELPKDEKRALKSTIKIG